MDGWVWLREGWPQTRAIQKNRRRVKHRSFRGRRRCWECSRVAAYLQLFEPSPTRARMAAQAVMMRRRRWTSRRCEVWQQNLSVGRQSLGMRPFGRHSTARPDLRADRTQLATGNPARHARFFTHPGTQFVLSFPFSQAPAARLRPFCIFVQQTWRHVLPSMFHPFPAPSIFHPLSTRSTHVPAILRSMRFPSIPSMFHDLPHIVHPCRTRFAHMFCQCSTASLYNQGGGGSWRIIRKRFPPDGVWQRLLDVARSCQTLSHADHEGNTLRSSSPGSGNVQLAQRQKFHVSTSRAAMWKHKAPPCCGERFQFSIHACSFFRRRHMPQRISAINMVQSTDSCRNSVQSAVSFAQQATGQCLVAARA